MNDAVAGYTDVKIHAITPPWQKKASVASVNNFLQELQKGADNDNDQKKVSKSGKSNFKGVEVAPEKPKPPPVMKISSISRDGNLGLEFDQDMAVPPFKESAGKRALETGTPVSLTDIDVSRDVLDLQFTLTSDVNVADVLYTLEITDWDTRKVNIFVNFTDPTMVSQGNDRDAVAVRIKNPAWFRSADGGAVPSTSAVP